MFEALIIKNRYSILTLYVRDLDLYPMLDFQNYHAGFSVALGVLVHDLCIKLIDGK